MYWERPENRKPMDEDMIQAGLAKMCLVWDGKDQFALSMRFGGWEYYLRNASQLVNLPVADLPPLPDLGHIKRHNPDELTESQIGDSYRLLSVEENDNLRKNPLPKPTKDLQVWSSVYHGWYHGVDGNHGGCHRVTYRTKKPEGYYLQPLEPVPEGPPTRILEDVETGERFEVKNYLTRPTQP